LGLSCLLGMKKWASTEKICEGNEKRHIRGAPQAGCVFFMLMFRLINRFLTEISSRRLKLSDNFEIDLLYFGHGKGDGGHLC
jgi:hypothetical protein